MISWFVCVIDLTDMAFNPDATVSSSSQDGVLDGTHVSPSSKSTYYLEPGHKVYYFNLGDCVDIVLYLLDTLNVAYGL